MVKAHADLWLIHEMLLELRAAAAEHQDRGLVLYTWFKRHPWIAYYVKLIKNPETDFGITSRDALRVRPAEMRSQLHGPAEILTLFARQHVRQEHRACMWGAYLARLPVELRATANCLLDRDLRCGLRWGDLNFALAKAGYKPL